MGKRSGEVINSNIEDILEEVQQQQQLEEDNPDIIFTGSRNDYSNKHQENEQQRQPTAQELYNLSPLIRQWLRSIRNVQALRSTNLD
ncbi:hypothetical protein MML48_7g00004534 [Holotrichia oblita]|uniref:Uncharacterized protein n=1 Tax=Holotrichia oblita TaxID=644536 RepID=A0ACB9SW49_HOLOL|nr:hypothetical protein MML48_7g00004534 [Holotrichia oblita]